MPILKKFGRSSAEHDMRFLIPGARRCDEKRVRTDIPRFLSRDPEALLGQWASAMDKIASKPAMGKKPSQYQRSFREDLGTAIWDDLTGPEGRFSELSSEQIGVLLRKWRRRVHPYPDGNAKGERPASPKGRLYATFAGDVGYGAADMPAIARKIRTHLLEGKLRKNGTVEDTGLIARRANSMAKNTLARIKQPAAPSWNQSDIDTYFGHGDVAKVIREAAIKIERHATGKIGWRMAATELFAHFGKVFVASDKVLSFKEAEAQFPGRIALHRAIEGCYRQLLKRHKKRDPKDVVTLLPADRKSLLRLLDHQKDNRSIADLVRRGRILHYEALSQGTNWTQIDRPLDIAASLYWTSHGQTQIKRDEVFVRVWRGVLSHANRTLSDWLAPDGEAGDLTGETEFRKALLATNVRTHEQSAVLFGARAEYLKDLEDTRDLASLIWKVFSRLRHDSFHFKATTTFENALEHKLDNSKSGAVHFVEGLLQSDWADSEARMRSVLVAAHVERFLDQGRLEEIWSELHPIADDHVLPPLPRFSRLTTRVNNTTKAAEIPEPVNRAAMQDPAVHCRYIVTRLIYETGFRAWVAKVGTEQVNDWIRQSGERAQQQNIELNKQDEELARMVDVVRLRPGQGIGAFLSELAALTATEFRVQAGYEPDRAAARKQAEWLIHLQCDVLGRAFIDYLNSNRLGWLQDALVPGKSGCDGLSQVADLPVRKAQESHSNDEAGLYAVLHLVPVDQVGRLLQQIRRWANGADPDPRVARLDRLLTLYLRMHDSKFEGGGFVRDHPDLTALFESPELLDSVLPKAAGEEEDARVPLRSLREMLRFGGVRVLKPIFEQSKITAKHLAHLEAFEKSTGNGKTVIENAQSLKQELHEILCKKRRFPASERKSVRDYLFATSMVIRHRQLTNHVRLVNHVRMNQILMSMLGRFADMAGMFERDLYFAFLATLHDAGKVPKDVFDPKALRLLDDGRVLEALKVNIQQLPSQTIHALQAHFKLDSRGKGTNRSFRNDFAHFNMLRHELDLTTAMNNARTLMSYDRKLKNAVSASVVTLMEREQIDVRWKMGGDHRLSDACINTRKINHLEKSELSENLRDRNFLSMVAALFKGKVANLPDDLAMLTKDRAAELATSICSEQSRHH